MIKYREVKVVVYNNIFILLLIYYNNLFNKIKTNVENKYEK